MRIAIVNSFFPPRRGGAETYVLNLSKHLQRRGHQVTVVCFFLFPFIFLKA
jgi:glycosyltransferase involved in cell wall biosynthesis